jgi:hypothetical protein
MHHSDMRTTLTLDPDNAVRLERLREQRDAGMKEVINDVIRRGLDVTEAPQKKRTPYKFRTLEAGKPLFNSPEELKQLSIEIQEEDDFEKLKRSGSS